MACHGISSSFCQLWPHWHCNVQCWQMLFLFMLPFLWHCIRKCVFILLGQAFPCAPAAKHYTPQPDHSQDSSSMLTHSGQIICNNVKKKSSPKSIIKCILLGFCTCPKQNHHVAPVFSSFAFFSKLGSHGFFFFQATQVGQVARLQS